MKPWGVNKPEEPWEYWGRDECRWMQENYLKGLKQAFHWSYADYPKKIVVGDCSTAFRDRSCPGHTSHSGGKCVDLNYLTYFKGYTHYGPENEKRLRIIVDNEVDQVMFAAVRNVNLWNHIRSIFPEAIFVVDERILEYLTSFSVNSGIEEYVKGSSPGKWNHHKHVHIDLGGTVLLPYDVIPPIEDDKKPTINSLLTRLEDLEMRVKILEESTDG